MTTWIRRWGVAGLAGLGLLQAAWAEKPDYRTEGQCDGLPAITSLQVAPEFCLALAASNLGRVRGVLALDPNHLLVTDMGRWDAASGRLLELTRKPGQAFEVKVLLKGLNRPHGIRRDAQGRILLAQAQQISRLELPDRLQPLITGLPAVGRHPLKAFVVDAAGAIWVNVGAPTDHCEAFEGVGAGSAQGCGQTGGPASTAAVWKFTPKAAAAEAWEGKPFAWGLRNSMGLAVHPVSGQLWQAENSRDTLPGGAYAKASPPDELNLVLEGRHYGWPHCTGKDMLDSSYGASSCKDFAAPARLLPAHAAPLGMLFYGSTGPAAWRGALVMAWHGYQPTGQRLMAWRFDARHQPVGEPQPLISGWSAKPGLHPMGAPTDIAQDEQGRLWITEDRNGTLLLLAPR
ncbi:MAG TPA: PQQ-dependent sugar dehydrogenase [Roseateles sp.]